MTFSAAKPGTWAVGEKLTSGQMNALDADHVKSVDKTGDTITGVVHLNSAGKVSADIHDSCISTVDSGISTNVSHGVSINHDTGLVLEGATCWPCFRTNRTRVVTIPPIVTSLSTSGGWSTDGYSATGPGTATSALIFEIPTPHDGATIASVDCVFAVGVSHSAVPTNAPTFNVQRLQDYSTVGVAPASAVSLSSGGGAVFSLPGTGALYYASGNLQRWTFTADQNNVVDRSKYRYVIALTDEGGTNSKPGNTYFAFIVHYSAIANMKFQ